MGQVRDWIVGLRNEEIARWDAPKFPDLDEALTCSLARWIVSEAPSDAETARVVWGLVYWTVTSPARLAEHVDDVLDRADWWLGEVLSRCGIDTQGLVALSSLRSRALIASIDAIAVRIQTHGDKTQWWRARHVGEALAAIYLVCKIREASVARILGEARVSARAE